MALLAKAAMLRVGMAKYPRYLYRAGLIELPAQRDWMIRNTAQTWNGYLFNADWGSANDDARQVTFLSQFGVFLYDQSGTAGTNPEDCCFFNPYMIGYRDLVPELAYLLVDKAKTEAEIYARKVKAFAPHWYASFAEGVLGYEHNLSHPIDAFQIFLAEAWINNASGDSLANYVDIPWLDVGDLFYLHKLAETANAYRGVAWFGSPATIQEVTSEGRYAVDGIVTFMARMRMNGEPITNTLRMTVVVPSGLIYAPGSLQVEPAHVGVTSDVQAPVLTWQGVITEGFTLRFQGKVTEQKLRTIEAMFLLEDTPGHVQSYSTSIVVNGLRNWLPLVLRN